MGTGLGLSLAKKLAEMLNGNITVKDNEAGGATFIFNFSDLPLLCQHKSELDSIPLEKEIIKDRSVSENKNSILIVEDGIIYKELFAQRLCCRYRFQCRGSNVVIRRE
jgi:hypothetical protein